MKSWFKGVLIALISIAIAGTALAQEHKHKSGKMAPKEYAQQRIEAIATAAALSEEEKEVIAVGLKKYDDVRLRTWVETRKVHKAMEALGDKATEEQYLKGLKQLQQLAAQRQQAGQDFFDLLFKKLPPKKAYLVYKSYRSFNANTGKRLRQ